MAGSGPPPNPNSRRQTVNQANTWTDLPAAGFTGPVPDFPFTDCSDREDVMWQRVWRTPQAAAWSTLGWEFEVALYVRVLAVAERVVEKDGNVDMKAITEARLRSLELGLTPTGMLKNRWRVRADEVAEKRTEKTAAKTKARRRLKVADNA
jgi:hypothetical protein